MRRDDGRVLALINQLYAAACEDDLWSGVLKEITSLLQGESSTLFFTDSALKPIDSFFGSNVSPESISSYRAHYHKVDIRLQRAIPNHIGRIVSDRDLVDETIVAKHEFYQDFLRPIGHRFIISAILDLGDDVFAFASCHLGLKQDHADLETLETAAILLPHLQRGLQLRRRMIEIRATEHAALEVLDRLGHGVFLLNENGRVVWQNVTADELLKQRDGLSTQDGELRAGAVKEENDLAALIKSAIQVIQRPKSVPGGVMNVSRPSARRAFQVLVAPLSRPPSFDLSLRRVGSIPVVGVFVTDPEANIVPRADILKKRYSLTRAETKLATALASGMSTKAYAEQEKRSIHYVRWLLKQVEAKTDTRRITDLIRLITGQIGFPEKLPGNDDE